MAFVEVKSNIDEWFKKAIVSSKAFTSPAMVGNLNKLLTRRVQRLALDQFESQGSGRHGRWKKLSKRYARWKAQKYPGKTILKRTDKLFRSAVAGTDSNITGGLSTGGGYIFKYRIKVIYAKFHQKKKYKPRPPTRRIWDPKQIQLKVISEAIGKNIVVNMFRSRAYDNELSATVKIRGKGFDVVDP